MLTVNAVFGQQPSVQYFQSGPGYVLLGNGEVFQGYVQAYDREVEIKLDDTGKVRFSNDKVLHVGKSLDELYLFQVNRIQRWAVGDHLKIGRWCSQQRMFEQAVQTLRSFEAADSNEQEFKRFQTELRDAMLRDQQIQQALRDSGYQILIPLSVRRTEMTAGSPKDNETAGRQAKTQQVTRLQARDHEVFRSDIHPILMSSCARAACHGAFSNNGFVLLDATRMSTRDAQGKNLAAFTNYIDTHKGNADALPEDHPLYQNAVNRHGPMFESVLDVNDTKHQRFMEQLRLWIARANSQQQLTSSELAFDFVTTNDPSANQLASMLGRCQIALRCPPLIIHLPWDPVRRSTSMRRIWKHRQRAMRPHLC